MAFPKQIVPLNSNDGVLKDSDVIWRYIPLKRLYQDYLMGTVFIPSLRKLREKEDYCEAESWFNGPDFNTAIKDHPEIEKEFKSESRRPEGLSSPNPRFTGPSRREYYRFLRNTRYVWCWFKNEYESSLMWESYGKGGVAIKTTVGSLAEVLGETEYAFVYGRVHYEELCDGKPTMLSIDNKKHRPFILSPHFLKREIYRQEEEIRFVTCAPPTGAKGLVLKMDPLKWIEKIRIYPRTPEHEVVSIETLIEKLVPGMGKRCSVLELKKADAFWEETDELQSEHRWESIPEVLKQPWRGAFIQKDENSNS